MLNYFGFTIAQLRILILQKHKSGWGSRYPGHGILTPTHAEAFGNKFDPVIKIVEVNPRSSYEILVVLKYPMLYTKFLSHRPLGSEEKDF